VKFTATVLIEISWIPSINSSTSLWIRRIRVSRRLWSRFSISDVNEITTANICIINYIFFYRKSCLNFKKLLGPEVQTADPYEQIVEHQLSGISFIKDVQIASVAVVFEVSETATNSWSIFDFLKNIFWKIK